MISWINPKIRAGRSATVKGAGLFARKKISKGEMLVVQGGKIVADEDFDHTEYKNLGNICFQIEKGFHICPIKTPKKYWDGVFLMNHSCEPNCGVRDQICFYAISDIKKGEEITYDYAMTDADYTEIPCEPIDPMICKCRRKSCRKIITCHDWKRRGLQRRYAKYFSHYIKDLIKRSN